MNQSLFAFLSMTMLACSLSGPLREDSKADSYALASSIEGWQELKQKADADRAWLNPTSGAIMSVRSLCGRYEHVSIRNLSKNLETVLQDVEVLSKKNRSIASREAYDTLLRGKLDGAPVESRMVVVRKNHCIFDFTVTEHPQLSPSSLQALDELLQSFDYRGEPIK